MEQKNEDSEKELIGLARKGDQRAFEKLVLKYKDRLYGIASGVCARLPSESEDVAQETMVAAFKHVGSFKANAAFSTWLYRIAANNCWQRMRRLKTEARADMPDDHSKGHPSRPSAGDTALKNELSRAVSRALAGLPPDLRSAVMLCDIEGLSGAEAAARLGVSLPALKSRLHRARAALQAQLKDFRQD